ncbi:hypothetical protein MPSEU_000687800 [Mayamaea pseudoterrestris]|nr:hypothetical protein MPSEU_000687800 [Mayamaea pseudoterrestris]
MNLDANAILSASLVAVAVAALTIRYAKYTNADKPSTLYNISDCNKDYQASGTLAESLGYLSLVVFSHFICYYLWWAAEFNRGCLGNPFPLDAVVIQKATPNVTSVIMYSTFIIYTLICAAALPGVTVTGYKIPSENNRRLQYNCNGLASWYVSIALGVALHYFDIFDWKLVYIHAGALLSTAILFANGVAVCMYLICLLTGRCQFRLETLAHDYVMGGYLNPRLLGVDLKLWAEVRVSWMLLFALNVSAALCVRDEVGHVPYRMWLVLLIQGLYTNACMKGEESIPFTWDIFHERWGWMLIFWNLAGVAFAYSFNGRFIASQGDALKDVSVSTFIVIVVAILAAYWVFDEANAQKNRFRAQQLNGGYVARVYSFPQLPNATLVNPKFLETQVGSKLLIDGWWRYVRKPHYTADLCLALLLSMTGGFDHVLPYFFVCFFAPMLVHRAHRDMVRCSQKYGADWDEYCSRVPYTFVPGVY